MRYEWTPAARDKVRKLWEAGHSGRQIAAAIGATKNSVIGVVHRMGLPARPSPIIRTGEPPKYVRRPTPQPLPPLKSVEAMLRESTPSQQKDGDAHPDRLSMGGRGARAVPPQLVAPVEAPSAGTPVGRVEPCCWVIHVNEKRRHHWFCIAPSVPGKPYCAAHCRQAYMRIPEKVDMAPWPGKRLSSGVQRL